MEKNYSFSLSLAFPADGGMGIIEQAIAPELNGAHSRRSHTELSLKKNMLAITIIAQDLVALRATLNGVIKKIMLATAAMEAVA
jgi:tRNA threonylcarbamoyladenosine modification (KEOPS) complex  Pcc1 subunit